MLNFRRGFTVLEALITLTLLGIVAAFVIPRFGEVKEQAYIDAMKNDLHNLALAENEHLLDHHGFVEPNLLENRDEWSRTEDVFQIRYLQDRGEWFFMEVGHRKTDVTCGLEYTPELDDDYRAIENRIECPPDRKLFDDGDLIVRTRTTDQCSDDGYVVMVEGGRGRAIGRNDEEFFAARRPGTVTVELLDIDNGCQISGGSNPREATIVAGDTTTTTFAITGEGGGGGDSDGTLMIQTRTTGEDLDPDGYQVSVSTSGSHTSDTSFDLGVSADGELVTLVDLNLDDEASLSDLAEGFYETALSDIASNCSITSGGSIRSAEVRSDIDYVIPYDLHCRDSDDDDDNAEPPLAAIDYTPTEPCVGEEMRFSGAGSSDPDGTIESYEWSFSDGETATGETIRRTYPSVEVLRADLTVVDDDGLTDQAEVSVAVCSSTEDDDPPVADFTHEPEGPIAPGSSYKLDASPSFDPEGTLSSTKEWNFGNGTSASVDTDITSVVFDSVGDYSVQLVVSDSAGQQDTAVKTLSVQEGGNPPIAKFSYDPQEPDNLDPVAFDGTASYDPDGGSVDHRWQFEDRVTKDGGHVEYVFSDIGTHEACLTVTDDEGDTDQECKFIEVGPRPPVAKFSHSPDTAFATDEVTFDGRDSFDEDGTIEDWTWTIEGGTKTGSVVTHTFADNGTYPVQLVVTDNDGVKDTLVQNIGIGNKNPVADFEVSPQARHANQQLTFDGSASHDPDGSIESWSWDIDGEATPSGEVVNHTFSTSGSKVIKLTVADNEGATDAKIDTILVAPPNEAPDAQLSVPNRRYEKTSVTIDGSGSSDSDGTIADYQWTFTKEDGSTSSSSGSATLDKIFTTHGTYQVELTVVDNDGATDTAVDSIRITQEAELVAHWDRCAGFDTGTYPDVAGGADATLISVEGDPDSWEQRWVLSNAALKVHEPPEDDWNPSDIYAALPTNGITSDATDFTIASRIVTHAIDGGAFLSVENTEGGTSWQMRGGGGSNSSVANFSIGDFTTTMSWQWHTIVVRVFEKLDGTQATTIWVDGEQHASGIARSVGDLMTMSGQMNLFADLSGNNRPTTSITDMYYYDGAATATEAQNLTNTLDSSTCPDANRAPTADFTWSPNTPHAGQSVTFDASASTDSLDSIEKYYWAFGDGNTANGLTSATTSHTYQEGGWYDVRLIAEDGHGARDTLTQRIRVSLRPELVANWDVCSSFDSGTFVEQVGDPSTTIDHSTTLTRYGGVDTTSTPWEDFWGYQPGGTTGDLVSFEGLYGDAGTFDRPEPDFTVSAYLNRPSDGDCGASCSKSYDVFRVGDIGDSNSWALDVHEGADSDFSEDMVGWNSVTWVIWATSDSTQKWRWYLNGQPYGTGTYTNDMFHRVSGPVYLYSDYTYPDGFTNPPEFDAWHGQYFDGRMGPLRYYSGRMTNSEVANLHSTMTGDACSDSEINRPPEADFTIKPTSRGSNPIQGEVTTLDASATTDIVNDGLTYTWMVNDNQIASGGASTAEVIDHTFDDNHGSTDITLVVDDGVTGADTVSKSVWVSEDASLVADYDPCEGGLGEDYIEDRENSLTMQLEGAGVAWDSVWNYAAPQNLDTFNHPNVEGWTGGGILTNAEELDRGKPDFTLAFYIFEAGDTGPLFRAMSEGGVPWSISDARAVSGEWSSLIVRFRKQGSGSQTKEWFVNGNFQQSVDLDEVLTVDRTSDGQWKFFQDTENHIHRIRIYDGSLTDSGIAGLHDGLVAGASTSCSN